ncbi:hypothetical protein DFH28DRAFT_909526, partial [Melampsora americana]
VPPRNQSSGFEERNRHLGQTWSSYNFDEKHVFNDQLFFLLGYLACGWDVPPAKPTTKALSTEDIEKYLPIYKRLVDTFKVAKDLGQGKFGPHLPTARQNKGISEVQNIDHQVRTDPIHLIINPN